MKTFFLLKTTTTRYGQFENSVIFEDEKKIRSR